MDTGTFWRHFPLAESSDEALRMELERRGLLRLIRAEAKSEVVEAFDEAFGACLGFTLHEGPTADDFRRSRQSFEARIRNK